MTIKAEPDLRIQLEAIKTKCEKLCANTCETGAAGGCFACEVWLDVQEAIEAVDETDMKLDSVKECIDDLMEQYGDAR